MYSTNHRGEVDDEHLIVGFYVETLDEFVRGNVREKIEDVLQLVDDRMVHW